MNVKAKNDNNIFLITCSLMIFYLSYRYPFGINSSTTSPTYIDTPLYLQVGKYLLLLFVIGFLCIRGVCSDASKINLKVLVVIFFIITYSIIKFVIYDSLEFVNQLPSYVLPIMFVSLIDKVELKALNNPIKWLLIISLCVNLLQVSLYFLYGRLPALAYENSVSVRFGSFLDDPNGFAILCFLLVGWGHVFLCKKVFVRACVQSMLFITILLTQSLTAIAISVLVYGFLYCRDKYIIIFTFLSICVFLYFNLYERLLLIFELKQGSIDQHADVSLILDDISRVLFGGDYSPTESWWIFSLNTNGVLITVSVFLWCIYSIFKCYSLYRLAGDDLPSRAVSFSIFIFSIAFFMASFNLPLFDVFPINFLCFSMWTMIALGKFYSTAKSI